jgi:hypothetical protein
VDALLVAQLDQLEIGIRVVEVLGDGRVGAGLDLALEVGEVGMALAACGWNSG